jgi:phage tail sheath gpL-like
MGSMAHRLAIAAFRGSNYSVPVYMLFEAEATDAIAASGSIALVGTTILAGVLYLYVAGTLYEITVTKGETITAIGDAIVAALAADKACPVSAVNAAGTVTFTSLSKGIWGNGITLAINQDLADDQELPSGLTVTITAMTGGSGVPTVAADLLTALGSGSNKNEQFFTDVIHGYGQNSTVLDALSQYVGEGNDYTGCYDRNVHRPFRSLTGDTATGSAGLTALVALGSGRLEDRCNGVIARPGSLTHPSEIAAEAIGYMAEENNDRAEASYCDLILSGVDPGDVARQAGNDWTQDYNNRDIAVKAGISPTIVEGGSVKMQNVVSFYHPASVPQTSNAYRSMRNISILQNILYNKWLAYSNEKWKRFTIVEDKADVTDADSREYARDRDDILDTELSLIESFAAHAWIYSKQYSINALKEADAAVIRTGGDGFTTKVPYILSGEGLIIDTKSLVDTSIAVTQTAA